MFNLIIVVGALLILGIILMLFRINTLVSIAGGKKAAEKRETPANRINGILFMVFLVASFIAMYWYSTSTWEQYNKPVASEHGVITDKLFWVTMVVTGIVFIITQILLFYFSYRYSFKEKARALFYPDNHKLEIIWTVVPAIALVVLVGTGLKSWIDITSKAPDESEVIEIMGFQFAWKVRYPGLDGQLGSYDWRYIDVDNEFGMDFNDENSMDDFMPRKLYLPVGKPVLLKIRAKDVLHSVYLPHFRVKMDAVPGMPTKFWFVPTKTTDQIRAETNNPEFNYELACTEVCGRGHFSMRMEVVVLEQDEYDEWYKAQEAWSTQNEQYVEDFRGRVEELPMTAGKKQQIEEDAKASL